MGVAVDIGFVARVLGAAEPIGFDRIPSSPSRSGSTARDEGPRSASGDVVSLSAEARARIELDASGPSAHGAAMGDEATGGSSASSSSDPGELTDEEQEEVVELKKRDAEVRAHENAHKAAAGQHARGGPTYEYERGPDGRRYAVGGEIRIDTSPVPDDPDATILKMRQVRRAALAPAEPSPQDRRVASEASQQESAARQEKMTQQREGRAEGGVRRSGAYTETAARPLGGTLDFTA